MPKSRKRRKPARHTTRRPTRPGPSPDIADLRALLTEEVMDALDRSMLAEASGDVEQAITHFQVSPLAQTAPHLRYLHEVRDLGDAAPGWVWSRWILQQAHRRLFLDQDDRLREALFLTVDSVYSEVDPEVLLDLRPPSFVSEVMAMDWMCRQLALYEMGGLAGFLETMARPPLLERADRITDWPTAPMGAFRIESVAAGEASLTDLATGAERQVLNIGWLADGRGACVAGRLVPMHCEPGWIFDSRPREVPDAVAEEVSRAAGHGALAWTRVLGDAVASGELDWPLGEVGGLTTLSSDLFAYTWSAPPGELAQAAFEVCETSLEAAAFSHSSAAQAAPFMAAVLTDSHVYAVARERLTGADHEAGWDALARNTHEPVRSRCRELAGLCRVAA